MLQWFNKQTNSSSLSQEAEFAQQRTHILSSDSALTDEDYEFLFNQLLDGVAHGWHSGKIVKFFNNLEPRSTPSQWIAWLLRFEKRIVFSNDPSQRRVGAIMMRLGELTQSDAELQELGTLASKIGKKLFLGNTAELIWEYDGSDRVVAEDTSATLEKIEVEPQDSLLKEEPTTLETDPDVKSAVDADRSETLSSNDTENLAIAEVRESVAQNFSEERETQFTEQPTQSPDFVAEAETSLIEDGESLNSLEELLNQPDTTELEVPTTEQPTQSPDFVAESETSLIEDGESLSTLDELLNQPDTTELEVPTTEQPTQSPDFVAESETSPIEDEESLSTLDELNQSDTPQELEVPTTEQPTQSPDFVAESQPQEKEVKKNLLESLEAFTEQLTVLQDIIPESDSPSEPDLETTLISPEIDKQDSMSPSSVASFLEATKALMLQKTENNITPLSWKQFITALEQDETLARQVARYLQISGNNPQDIVKAAVERLTQQEKEQMSPATLELIESWFHLGLKQASAEDFPGAIASWDKALKLNPNLSEAWHNRGSALGRLGRYEEAIQSFNRAINLTPRHDRAWNDRAHALYQLHKWEQAIESWNKAISITSDNYQFWYNRGCALEQLQRFEESISSYEKALEIKPDFQPARTRYISLITENSSSSSN